MEILLGLSGVLASILGLVLAFYAVFVNGKNTKAILLKMDERLEKMDVSLKKMDEGLKKMDEGLKKMDERHTQILLRMEENQKYIAELVKTESDKIIQEVKK